MPDFKRKKIEQKNLGEILKVAREKKELTLDEAEEETKVRAKYLEALENGRYDTLPGNVYALGFLTKYADFLELDRNEIVHQFKLERGEARHAGKFMVSRRFNESRFSVTPRLLTILIVTMVILAILSYIGYNVRNFMLPPNLVITGPVANEIIKENNVMIVGKTDSGSTVLINDQAVMPDANGNFSQMVKLNPGLNTFQVKSVNGLKKETDKEVKILAQF